MAMQRNDINSAEMIAKSEAVVCRLKLISNANRLRILCRLLDGELSVGDIETELEIRQPTLSREIGRLREAGVISPRRHSKVVFYTLSDPKMKTLVQAVCAASSGANITLTETASSISAPASKIVSFNPRPKLMMAAIQATPNP